MLISFIDTISEVNGQWSCYYENKEDVFITTSKTLKAASLYNVYMYVCVYIYVAQQQSKFVRREIYRCRLGLGVGYEGCSSQE